MLGKETFPCEQSTVLKRNIQFRNVGEDRIALAFEKRSMGVAHHRAVNDAGGDRLHARARVTDDSEGDAVAFGLNAPMLEGQHGEHPVAAAEAGHTDPLPFRSDGVLMSWPTAKAPTSLLMNPATKTPSRPFRTAPKLAPEVVP